MKFLWLLLLLPYFSFSQTEVRDSITYLTFKVNHPQNISEKDFDEVDFSKEQPESEFTLKGKIPLIYRFKLQNDTIATLSKLADGKSVLTEAVGYQSYFLYRNDDGYLHSNYKITDFDEDGDEDLLCWIYSNMNGNVWTIIFLNDQKTQSLVKLWNTAEDTDIWDRPEYDSTTRIINTTLDAGVYGISNEATYKLEYLTAAPLTKDEQNRNDMTCITDNHYIGQNGKWQLERQERECYLYFKFSESFNNETEDVDWAKENVETEFELSGKNKQYYKLKLINDEKALLYQKNEDDRFVVKDTIEYTQMIWEWTEPNTVFSTFKIVDFNKDGNEDLVLWANTNVNGNIWTNIWLNDPQAQTLKLLYNTAEDSDIWAAPEYNPETQIISCTQVSGMFGLEFESSYKLHGIIAEPIEKVENDNIKLDSYTGKGGVKRLYKGKKGKWKLIKSQKIIYDEN